MYRFVCLLALLLVSCAPDEAPSATESKDPLGDRIRSEWRARLIAAARGAGADIVLADDTPRVDMSDVAGPGTMSAYLPSASFRLPLPGLNGFAVVCDGDGMIEVRLRYGEVEVALKDLSGAAGAALAALKGVGADLGTSTWAETETAVRAWAAENPAEGLNDRLAAFARNRSRWDQRYDKRFAKKLFDLRRFALRARIDEDEAELSDLYRNCRLVLVKRQLVASLGGPAGSPVRPFAAGPAVGLIREAEGATYVALDGPDGMVVQVRVGGKLEPATHANLVGSYRPYARDRGAPGRLDRAVRDAPPLQAASAALSAVLLEPSVDRATTFLAALKRVPGSSREGRERSARALARWLRADETATAKLVAAAQ